MGSAESNSPVPVTGAAFFDRQTKDQQFASRRPPVTSAAQLLGPGFGANCITTADWNSDACTYNGMFVSALNAAANVPPAADALAGSVGVVGEVVSAGTLGGFQTIYPIGIGVDTGISWQRQFVRSPLDPTSITWGAWNFIDPHVTKGQPTVTLGTPKTTTISSGASYQNLAMNGVLGSTQFGTANMADYFTLGINGINLLKAGVYALNFRLSPLNSLTWDGMRMTYPLADGSSNVLIYSNPVWTGTNLYSYPLIVCTPNTTGIVQIALRQTSGSAQNMAVIFEATYLGPFA